MKNTKIIITLIAVAVILTISLAFVISAETTPNYTGTVDEANTKLQVSIGAKDAQNKNSALDELSKYMRENPIDPSSPGYAELEKNIVDESFACAKLYLDAVNTDRGTAKNQVLINRLSAFMKAHDISSHKDYNEFMNVYTEKRSQQDKAIIANKEALDKKSNLDDYELTPDYSNDYDSKGVGGIMSNGVSGVDKNGNPKKNFVGTEEKDGNKFYSVKYQGALKTPTSSGIHTYIWWNFKNGEKGRVFDFDFTTFGVLPGNGIKLESGETADAKRNGSTRIFPVYLFISNEGHIQSREGETYLENAVVPGEWLHISVVVHPDTYISDIYVEYELVGSFDCRPKGDKRNFTLTSPKFGAYNGYGEFSIDNVKFYPGQNVLIFDKFDNMTDDEKFVYYTEYFVDEEKTVLTRNKAYNIAKDLIKNYYDFENKAYLTDKAELRATVDLFINFDYDKLIADFSAYNLVEFGKMMGELESIERSPKTYDERLKFIEKIEEFLDVNAKFILKNEEFDDYFSRLSKANLNIDNEDNITEFIVSMKRFTTATTLASLTRHYNDAKKYVDDGLETALLDNPEFSEFKKYYDVYLGADTKVDSATRDDNSRRFIVFIELIKEFKTEQDYIDNYDFIEKNILVARNIIYENRYNPEYQGFKEAFEIYQNINGYFYNKLQEEHIKVIQEKLDKFEKTDKYIEKLGICSYVEVYFADNDIDLSNPEIVKLKNRLDKYKSTLTAEEDAYVEALRDNTKKFIEVVNTLQNCKGYSQTKEIYERAKVYYYAMNIGSEEAKEALKIFDSYTKKLYDIEYSSEKLIETVAMMKNASDNEIFGLLIDGYNYKTGVSEEYEGIPDALKTYNMYYDSYMNSTNEINSEIESTVQVVGSLRVVATDEKVVSNIINRLKK